MNDEPVSEVQPVDRRVPESSSAKAVASADRSVPQEIRSPSLKQSVQYFVKLTAQLSKDFPAQSNLFYFLIYQCLPIPLG